uniref:Uncharacterized protein n=1 Tax=Hyaloperonospora arabidopsidis (strain Emoy2) TaxID=559515 RepID=M4B330_HYAAE
MALEGAPLSSQIKHRRRVRNEDTEYNIETRSRSTRKRDVITVRQKKAKVSGLHPVHNCKGVTHRRVLGTLCLRRTGWYPTERDIEYLIGL